MRISFWRGIITGSIVGAAISMITAGRRQERRGILGYSSKQVRSRANRVLRGVSRAVNDLIK